MHITVHKIGFLPLKEKKPHKGVETVNVLGGCFYWHILAGKSILLDLSKMTYDRLSEVRVRSNCKPQKYITVCLLGCFQMP